MKKLNLNHLSSTLGRNLRRTIVFALISGTAFFLPGCGGGLQDFGGLSRSLSGEISNGYSGSLGGIRSGTAPTTSTILGRGVYPMIETSFKLPELKGDPFDYEQNVVLVTLKQPDGSTVDVPCFYDGDSTWRMRYTPNAPGKFTVVSVKHNREIAREDKIDKKEWDVSGQPLPGFVRIDRADKTRFLFDSGERFYPLGQNVGWESDNTPKIPEIFGKMKDSGANWSRVWMCHWDGKNLDWNEKNKDLKIGEIDLTAAKKWDEVVASAQKNNIYLQMVLQHHGQYSSKEGYRFSGNVNPNWETNPYNAKNGGFLETPESFFIHPKARKLTRNKLYYILARWGYSPNIMAFELFNEVQFTDAAKGGLLNDIALWHREMALFLRQYDGYKHLITTSSAPEIKTDSPIWETVDFLQYHGYPQDVITAQSAQSYLTDKITTEKPAFYGEYGPPGLQDPDGNALHASLWMSVMQNSSGASQYWAWDEMEKKNLYPAFKSVSAFLTASSINIQSKLRPVSPTVQSSDRAALRFSPSGGWKEAKQNEFVVGTSVPAGIGSFPSYLQGDAHRNMVPKPLSFQVNFEKPGTFTMRVGEVSKAGAKIVLSASGKTVEKEYAADAKNYTPKADDQQITIPVEKGIQTVTIQNTGKDWVVVRDFAFSDYTAALGSYGKISKQYAALWIFHRDQWDTKDETALKSATGRITLPELEAGTYRVTWWNTRDGRSLDSNELVVGKAKESATINIPPIKRDIAVYITKAATPDKKKATAKARNRTETSIFATAQPATPADADSKRETKP